MSPAAPAAVLSALKVQADAQLWHPALVALFAAQGAALPLRADVEVVTHHGAAFRLDDSPDVITARHVVAGSRAVTVDGQPAALIWEDRRADLAILRPASPLGAPLRLGEVPPVGAPLTALGFGGGLGLQTALGALLGVVQRQLGEADGAWLDTTCEVRPGFSGGPLLAGDAVIGVVVGGRETAGEPHGPAIALPVHRLRGAWDRRPRAPRWPDAASLRRDAGLP